MKDAKICQQAYNALSLPFSILYRNPLYTKIWGWLGSGTPTFRADDYSNGVAVYWKIEDPSSY